MMRFLRRRTSECTVWLPVSLRDRMIEEAREHEPCETGGVLLGYEAGATDVIVCALIGAGPKAKRRRSGFEPDGEWQEPEIANAYERSGRIQTYLGDWHSHPEGVARPSRRDRDTAHRIAKHREARAPRPLMLIVARDDEEWEAAAYRLNRKRMTRARFQLCRLLVPG
jgi:integrative and conjugative element protein (TIGR02256 family)